MINRLFLFKVIVVAVLIYLFGYIVISTGTSNVIRELQQSGRSLAALDSPQIIPKPARDAPLLEDPLKIQGDSNRVPDPLRLPGDSIRIHEEPNGLPRDQNRVFKDQNGLPGDANRIPEDLNKLADSQNSQNVNEIPEEATQEAEVPEDPTLDKVRAVTNCLDRPMVHRTQQRGDYWVLYNYVQAEKRFKCHESVTYTTHADYSFIDNLLPLVERWQGPISLALHAPGSDFASTLQSIAYLRDCASPLVKDLVTFHIYFSTKHVPKEVPRPSDLFQDAFNCSLAPPYLNVTADQMYKAKKKLLYPVNVGRNVARESAQTHFILPSDIELYPSLNMIGNFLELVAENKGPLLSTKPKVFVLHLFEVSANSQVPETKTQLKEMFKNGTALPFHKKLCPECHNVPKSKEWQQADETDGLHVFHVGKRQGPFSHWEPIYIGTHAEPLYDERLSWEGKRDKMTQGYVLCVLNYEFLILDNAFLVHRPGIKVYRKDHKRAVLAAKTNQLINKIILPELRVIYGHTKGCTV